MASDGTGNSISTLVAVLYQKTTESSSQKIIVLPSEVSEIKKLSALHKGQLNVSSPKKHTHEKRG